MLGVTKEKPMPLTDIAIRTAKPAEKAYKMTDGDGMFLSVRPNGSKLWQMKYRFAGKEKLLSIGQYPQVTLAEARERRLEARKLLGNGIDPSTQKQETRRQAELDALHTFEAVAHQWHEKNLNKWSSAHAAKIWRRIELHLLPRLGKRPVKDIKPLELLRVLQEVENRGTTEISHRILQTAQEILNFAVIMGLTEYNAAMGLGKAMKAHKTRNYPALPLKELPEFLAKLDACETSQQNKLAIHLLMHTFVRQGEMRHARWTDIDWEKAEWRLPPETTKMKSEHVVPLSRQTLAILKELFAITGNNPHGVILPSQHYQKHTIMSENTINLVFKRLGYKGRMVGHGFRSIASTALNETGFPPDVIERQLAHTERNKVRASYNRADYMEQRKAMMQVWSDRLDQLEGKNIVQLKTKVIA
jgi:integrase